MVIIWVKRNGFSKTLFREESNRVPFVWAGGDVAKGQECSTPVTLLDIFPTLKDCFHLNSEVNSKHEKYNLELDGFSLKPLLENPEKRSLDGSRNSSKRCGQ